MDFPDHFSSHAGDYADHRPRYPAELFEYVASIASGSGLAWDCGCGSGQAAMGLVDHFDAVVATDASEAQLAHARRHPRIEYHAVPAERCPLPASSADAVVVAQALHWFRLDAFYDEVRRVARPRAPLVAWAYGLHRIAPAIDVVVDRFYDGVVGPFWPPERRFIDERYATLPMPLPEQPAPSFVMTHRWTFAQLIAYVSTWSAVKRYEQKLGHTPLDALRDELAPIWGPPERARDPLAAAPACRTLGVAISGREINLGGRYVLADAQGPFGSPITDSRRTAVNDATRTAAIIVYAPTESSVDRLQSVAAAIGQRVVECCGGRVTQRDVHAGPTV